MTVTVVETNGREPFTVWAREWLKDHWKLTALVGGGALLVSGGALYWHYNSGLKKKTSNNRKEGHDSAQVEESDTAAESTVQKETEVRDEAQTAAQTQTKNDVVDRAALAQAAKSEGNTLYAAKKYQEAIKKYGNAIEYQGHDDKTSSIFYGNRAACWSALGQSENAVADCNAALELDPCYIKALMRRAMIYEKMGDHQAALHDYTTTCVFEEFKNQNVIEAADRMLRKLANLKAVEMFQDPDVLNRNELPSDSFVSSYASAFNYNYENAVLLDAHVSKAVGFYQQHQFGQSFKELSALSIADISDDFTRAVACNLAGTFQFLIGRIDNAKHLMEQAAELVQGLLNQKQNKPAYKNLAVNTLIKQSGLIMEEHSEENVRKCLEMFAEALVIDNEDPDIFYHRGQVYFLLQDFSAAKEQYQTAITLYPTLPKDSEHSPAQIFCRIQKAVTEYRDGGLKKALRLFENMEKQFDWCAEVYYYHGEILLDSQNVEEALECFEIAHQRGPKLPLPLLNKAIIFTHVKGDLEQGYQLTKQVLDVDPKCELAYIHMAQYHLNKGELQEAIKAYTTAVGMSRNMADAENGFMGLEAARAQKVATERVKAAMVEQ